MKRRVAIIQARMGSSRLPGKTLLSLAGTTVLGFMIERLKRCRKVDQIIIATTTNIEDNGICDAASELGVSVFRGKETDVLGRFVDATKIFDADIIIRLTADCPFADPELVDYAVERFDRSKADYLSNVVERSFPDGLDVEVFTKEALWRANVETQNAWHREHVTTFMRTGADLRYPPGEFTIEHFHADVNFKHLRWTLDTLADYEFLVALANQNTQEMGWLNIVSLLTKHHELMVWGRGICDRDPIEQIPQHAYSHKGYNKSSKQLNRALQTIPVGSQTFSKSYLGWVLDSAPLYAKSGKGAYLIDLDDNVYIDYVMGLLPVVLGYSDPTVDAAVIEQIGKGVSLSLPGELESDLAEKLVELIPCAEMVRFGKNGSDATSAAIRLARAYTGREKIVVCGYHGWHDWYIGTTAKHLGVPDSIRELSLEVPFNDVEAFEHILVKNRDKIAAIIVEPTGKLVPKPGYLDQIRGLCDKHRVILIFDEVISGFRAHIGGAQAKYGVVPDLAAFGKAMANGYPLSALVGKKEYMSRVEDIFFSTTFAGELSSIAASLATIEKLEATGAVCRIASCGETLIRELNERIKTARLDDFIQFAGETWWPRVALSKLPVKQNLMMALLRQEFTAQGLLIAAGLNLCLAHDDKSVVQSTLSRAERSFESLSKALLHRNPEQFLKGPVALSDFEVRGHVGVTK